MSASPLALIYASLPAEARNGLMVRWFTDEVTDEWVIKVRNLNTNAVSPELRQSMRDPFPSDMLIGKILLML